MERTQQQRRSPVGEQLEWGVPAPRPTDGERPFEPFYRLEMPRLVALARSLCGGAAADDVAQEAMLSAYRHWHRVSEMDWPEAYVRRTCANLVRACHPGRRRSSPWHYVCDLGVAKVAATLELPVGTVKVHLSRARAAPRPGSRPGATRWSRCTTWATSRALP
jgi:DNA-directed RNA polymerase specialized sigma24 family protein